MCKICSRCELNKPLSAFAKDGAGTSVWCKACVNSRAKDRYRADPRKALLRSSKDNARPRGISNTLTLEDIPPIPTHCPILGLPLQVGAAGRTDNSPSLDRIDNAKGYIPGNVVLVSWRANRLKGSATATELMQLANFYKELLNV